MADFLYYFFKGFLSFFLILSVSLYLEESGSWMRNLLDYLPVSVMLSSCKWCKIVSGYDDSAEATQEDISYKMISFLWRKVSDMRKMSILVRGMYFICAMEVCWSVKEMVIQALLIDSILNWWVLDMPKRNVVYFKHGKLVLFHKNCDIKVPYYCKFNQEKKQARGKAQL